MMRIRLGCLAFAVLFVIAGCTDDEPTSRSLTGSELRILEALQTGACCLPDGSCILLTEQECKDAGGTYQGDETACEPDPCSAPPPPPPAEGACCLADGSCVTTTADDCAKQGGTYQGDDAPCDPNPCPQPPPPPPAQGACCLADGSCITTTADDCATQGGTYQGDDAPCDPNPCPQPQPGGCGHGYWKNHESDWEPTGYAPEDPIASVFTTPVELQIPDGDTFMDALRYPGGNGPSGAARLLLRHAIGAVLNAAHPDVNYPLTLSEVTAQVDSALASLDRKTMLDAKNDLERNNGGGCPLGR